MADILGQSFSPASQQSGDPTLRKKRTPVQQALQTVSLQLPTYTGGGPDAGGNAIAADLLSGRGGGVSRAAGSAPGTSGTPYTQGLLNALTSGMPSGAAGASQQKRKRGWAGAGFGDTGPVSGGGAIKLPGAPSTPSAGTLPGVGAGGGPKPPSRGGGGGMGGFGEKVADVIAGLPKPSGGGGLPSIPGLPKPGGGFGGGGGMKPGGGFQIPPSLMPPKMPSIALPKPKPPHVTKPAYEAPEPGEPGYVNPSVPGGGLLEHLGKVIKPPTPKPVVTPPTPPPVNFGRGSDPRFQTPTGGAGAGPSGPPSGPPPNYYGSGYQPAAAPANPSKGGVYYRNGVPYAYGPSGPPPGVPFTPY